MPTESRRSRNYRTDDDGTSGTWKRRQNTVSFDEGPSEDELWEFLQRNRESGGDYDGYNAADDDLLSDAALGLTPSPLIRLR
jgi:hypothetical protein